MSTNQFSKSTATIAAWNLATFHSPSDERIERLIDRLYIDPSN